MAEQIPMDRLREAAIGAEACIRLDAARQYGFLNGGPSINVERCEEVISIAREHGLTWTDDEVVEYGTDFVKEYNATQGGEGTGVL